MGGGVVVAAGISGGGVAEATGGIAVVSGAVVEGGGVAIADAEGAEVTGAAACTFFCAQPVSRIRTAHAHNARSARASILRLGINIFIFSEGLAEVADFPGRHLHGACQRQLDPESGSAPYLRIEFYLTIVQLDKSKRIREADARAAWPRGEKKLKYLLLILGRNPFSGICN